MGLRVHGRERLDVSFAICETIPKFQPIRRFAESNQQATAEGVLAKASPGRKPIDGLVSDHESKEVDVDR